MTYPYRCDKGHLTERDFPLGAAEDDTVCDSCSGPAFRVFSVGNITLGEKLKRR